MADYDALIEASMGEAPADNMDAQIEQQLADAPPPLETADGRFRVLDGDTIEEKQTGEKIRLNGIDAYELGQMYGDRGKGALKELLDKSGNVQVKRTKRDVYGRTVADLIGEGGNSINKDMVSRGAEADTYKGGDPELVAEGRTANLRFAGVLPSDKGALDAQIEAALTDKQFDPTRRQGRNLTLGQEFGEGVRRGTDALQAAGYGAVALAGSALGVDSIRDWGMEGYRRNEEEGAQHAPSVTFKEMEIGEDFFQWAAGAFGEAMPSLGTMMAGGGVGAQLGRGFVKRQVERKIRRDAEEKLIKQGATRERAKFYIDKQLGMPGVHKKMYNGAMMGAGGGGYLASATPQQGDIFAEIYQEAGVEAPGTAALAGGLAGMLDTAAMGYVVKKLFPGMPAEATKRLLLDTAKASGIQTMIEGSTEATQEFIASVARSVHDDEWDPLGEESLDRIKSAAATGALVGSVTGGLAGAIAPGKAPEQEPPPQPEPEETPPAPPKTSVEKAVEEIATGAEKPKVEGEVVAPEAPPPEAEPAPEVQDAEPAPEKMEITKALTGFLDAPEVEGVYEEIADAAVANPEKDPFTEERQAKLVQALRRQPLPVENIPNWATARVKGVVDGKEIEVEMRAGQAIKAIDKEMGYYQRLQKCLKA